MNWSTLADHVSAALQQKRSKGLGLRRRSQQQHLRTLWIFCAIRCCSQGCATPLLGPPCALQADPPSQGQILRAAARRTWTSHPTCRPYPADGQKAPARGSKVLVRTSACERLQTRVAAAGHSDGLALPATSTCATWCSLPQSGLWTGLCTHSARHTAAPAAGLLCCLCTTESEQGCSQLITSLIAQLRVAAAQLSMCC